MEAGIVSPFIEMNSRTSVCRPRLRYKWCLNDIIWSYRNRRVDGNVGAVEKFEFAREFEKIEKEKRKRGFSKENNYFPGGLAPLPASISRLLLNVIVLN